MIKQRDKCKKNDSNRLELELELGKCLLIKNAP